MGRLSGDLRDWRWCRSMDVVPFACYSRAPLAQSPISSSQGLPSLHRPEMEANQAGSGAGGGGSSGIGGEDGVHFQSYPFDFLEFLNHQRFEPMEPSPVSNPRQRLLPHPPRHHLPPHLPHLHLLHPLPKPRSWIRHCRPPSGRHPLRSLMLPSLPRNGELSTSLGTSTCSET